MSPGSCEQPLLTIISIGASDDSTAIHNISKLKSLTVAQEYVKILNEIDASVSTSKENPNAIDEDIASMDKAVNVTDAELEKMEQHHANMNETIASLKIGLKVLLLRVSRFMRDTERSISGLGARVRENSQYKSGLETQLAQIEGNLNENQHAVTNLTSSMENFTMVNRNFTNMLEEFESSIETKDHSDSKFHTFVKLYFNAIIFLSSVSFTIPNFIENLNIIQLCSCGPLIPMHRMNLCWSEC